MGKTLIWAWCVFLALVVNKLMTWASLPHVPPTAFIGVVVIGFTVLRNLTTGPVTQKAKTASWVLSALVAVGSVLVYVLPTPVPVDVPDVPAVVDTIATPANVAQAPDVVPVVTPVVEPATTDDAGKPLPVDENAKPATVPEGTPKPELVPAGEPVVPVAIPVVAPVAESVPATPVPAAVPVGVP